MCDDNRSIQSINSDSSGTPSKFESSMGALSLLSRARILAGFSGAKRGGLGSTMFFSSVCVFEGFASCVRGLSRNLTDTIYGA